MLLVIRLFGRIAAFEEMAQVSRQPLRQEDAAGGKDILLRGAARGQGLQKQGPMFSSLLNIFGCGGVTLHVANSHRT